MVKIRPRGPLAIRLAVTKLLPQIEPLLAKHALRWDVALPALEKVCHYITQPLVELYEGCMVVLKVS